MRWTCGDVISNKPPASAKRTPPQVLCRKYMLMFVVDRWAELAGDLLPALLGEDSEADAGQGHRGDGD